MTLAHGATTIPDVQSEMVADELHGLDDVVELYAGCISHAAFADRAMTQKRRHDELDDGQAVRDARSPLWVEDAPG